MKTHGTSCHTLEALKTAAKHPWVQVDLARINPAGIAMDADPRSVISVLREMKAKGKGVIGMKILGAGRLRNKTDEMPAVCARSIASIASPSAPRAGPRFTGSGEENPRRQRARLDRS